MFTLCLTYKTYFPRRIRMIAVIFAGHEVHLDLQNLYHWEA